MVVVVVVVGGTPSPVPSASIRERSATMGIPPPRAAARTTGGTHRYSYRAFSFRLSSPKPVSIPPRLNPSRESRIRYRKSLYFAELPPKKRTNSRAERMCTLHKDPSRNRHHEDVHGYHERFLRRHDAEIRVGGEARPPIVRKQNAAGVALQHRDEADTPGRVEEARRRRGIEGREELRFE
jgi:hypothetical protein